MSQTLNQIVAEFLYEGKNCVRRRADGYWCATDMVKAYNEAHGESKDLSNWTRHSLTSDLIALVADELRIEYGVLIQGVQGNTSDRGTWIHEELVLALAQWLSTEFYYWCHKRLKEVFSANDLKLQAELKAVYNPSSESMVRDFVANEYHAINAEVQMRHLDKKFIPDLISNDFIIEVKKARDWSEAKGQIEVYRDRLKDLGLWGKRRALIYLFDNDGWLTTKEFDFAVKSCSKSNIWVQLYPYHHPKKDDHVFTKTFESVDQYKEELARYIATDINTGKEYKLIDLKTFCKDMGLDYSAAIKCCKGLYNRVKNFKVRYATEEIAKLTSSERKGLASAHRDPDKIVVCENIKTGEVSIVSTIRGWCLENHIRSSGNIQACLKGDRSKAYGHKWYYLVNLPEHLKSKLTK